MHRPANIELLSPPPDGEVLHILLSHPSNSVNKMAGAEGRVSEIQVLYLSQFLS